MSETSPVPAPDPEPRPSPRVGDAERHRTIDALSDAFAAGRLTQEEFEERSTAALAARTEADLAVLVADLPAPSPAPGIQPLPSGRRPDARLIAVMSGVERRGRWVAASRMSAVAVMGGVELDFRGAHVDGREVRLAAVAFMGGIDIVVPDDWSVSMSGLSFMGGREVRGEPSTTAPTVHLEISGWAVMGGVSVKHKPRRAELP